MRKIKKALKRTKKPAVKKAAIEAGEEKAVLKRLHRIAINAWRRAQRHNASVTVIRDGKIIKVYPDRRERVLGTVPKTLLKVDISKPFRIK